KCLVSLVGPFKGYILFCEVVERSGYGSDVSDESLIEVSKTEEGLYFFQVLRGWPGGDSLDLYRVHRYVIRRDNKPKVFNCVRFKGAFGRF
ncbi:hypothetical protein HETIRDRAFT_325025, partial [Heterobasidion irregulare TC 32-1]